MLTILHRAAQLVGTSPSGALSIVEDGSLFLRDGVIEWVGPAKEMPAVVKAEGEPTWIDARGKVLARGITYVDARIARGDSRQFSVSVPTVPGTTGYRVTVSSFRPGFSNQGPQS